MAIDVAMQCYTSPTRTLVHPGLILIILHKIPWACSSSTLNLMFLMHLFLFQSLNFLKDWEVQVGSGALEKKKNTAESSEKQGEKGSV